MKYLKYILFLLLMAFIAFSVFVALKPNTYQVSKSAIIKAPREVLFDYLSDLNNAKLWMDEIKGDLTISEINQDNSIQLILQPIDEPSLQMSWNLNSQHEKYTKLDWNMQSSTLPFMFKAKQLFKGDIDSLVGLKMVKAITILDSLLLFNMNQYQIEIKGFTQHSGGFYIFNHMTCKLSEFEKNKSMLFEKLKEYISTENIIPSGAPFTIYHQRDAIKNMVRFSCAIPTSTELTIDNEEINVGYLSSFKTLKTILKGDYKYLNKAWKETNTYLEEHKIRLPDSVFKIESFIKTPYDSKNPANWVTEIYIAVE